MSSKKTNSSSFSSAATNFSEENNHFDKIVSLRLAPDLKKLSKLNAINI